MMAQLVKNLPAMWETQRLGFDPGVRKIPWSRKWKPTPVFLPEKKSHGQRSLAYYNPKVCKGSNPIELLSTALHFCN